MILEISLASMYKPTQRLIFALALALPQTSIVGPSLRIRKWTSPLNVNQALQQTIYEQHKTCYNLTSEVGKIFKCTCTHIKCCVTPPYVKMHFFHYPMFISFLLRPYLTAVLYLIGKTTFPHRVAAERYIFSQLSHICQRNKVSKKRRKRQFLPLWNLRCSNPSSTFTNWANFLQQKMCTKITRK